MTSAPAQRRPVGPLVVAGLAGVAHLAVGFYYLLAGLAIPGQALIPLWIFWLVLAAWLVRLAIRRSWWTAAMPLMAAAVLVVTAMIGDAFFGWTA